MKPALLAFLISDLANIDYYLRNPWLLLVLVFQIWMLVDAVRNEEWIWAVFILLFSGLTAILYYFLVYRSRPTVSRGFELPGSHLRSRIKELEAQIHHLDKAHHHLALGDIYFQQGKYPRAEASYRAALERDPQDLDIQGHLGQCLLRQKRAAEARPFLEHVCEHNPRHDYGHSQMALAETLSDLDERDAALATWKKVLEEHTYARARVQLAELHLEKGEKEEARAQIDEAIQEHLHAPAFQRKSEAVWIRRAKALKKSL